MPRVALIEVTYGEWNEDIDGYCQTTDFVQWREITDEELKLCQQFCNNGSYRYNKDGQPVYLRLLIERTEKETSQEPEVGVISSLADLISAARAEEEKRNKKLKEEAARRAKVALANKIKSLEKKLAADIKALQSLSSVLSAEDISAKIEILKSETANAIDKLKGGSK